MLEVAKDFQSNSTSLSMINAEVVVYLFYFHQTEWLDILYDFSPPKVD